MKKANKYGDSLLMLAVRIGKIDVFVSSRKKVLIIIILSPKMTLIFT